MSQVTEQSVRFQTALASIKLIQASAVLDLTEDDFDFLTSNKVWIATDRSRARRCVEACVYGTLDFVGYPRFPAPVEFIAAVIAYYVHPVNIQTACLIMEGAEFTENIINGRHPPNCMFSCLQILEAFLWFVLITLLNVTLIILTLSVSRLLNLLLRLVAFLLFLNPQCLASISRWITASSSWKRFCLFVCRALSSIMVICMLTAIRLLLTFVMSLYLLLRS